MNLKTFIKMSVMQWTQASSCNYIKHNLTIDGWQSFTVVSVTGVLASPVETGNPD